VDLWFINKHMDQTMIDIGKRLEQIRTILDLTQDEMGEILGKGKGSISKYENGDATPPISAIKKYAEIGNVTFDWIFTGTSSSSHVFELGTEYKSNKTSTIPVRAVAGAGDPCDLDQLEPIGHITIGSEYNGVNITALQIRGTSMEPNIMNGAHVGIDRADKEVISGQLYAVYIPHEGIVVKRIFIGPELVKIKSDNPSFPDHDLSIDRINWDTFVQGRVKWVLQKY
jgi:transcriptional regulator with XRE-family HTH domain